MSGLFDLRIRQKERSEAASTAPAVRATELAAPALAYADALAALGLRRRELNELRTALGERPEVVVAGRAVAISPHVAQHLIDEAREALRTAQGRVGHRLDALHRAARGDGAHARPDNVERLFPETGGGRGA